MLDVDLYKTPHNDQVNRNRRGNTIDVIIFLFV